MSGEQSPKQFTKEAIFSDVAKAIQEIAPSQLDNALTADTLLGADLGLKSLDFVRFVSALQQKYVHKMLPFQELFMSADGNFQQDIKISDFVDFLYRQLND